MARRRAVHANQCSKIFSKNTDYSININYITKKFKILFKKFIKFVDKFFIM